MRLRSIALAAVLLAGAPGAAVAAVPPTRDVGDPAGDVANQALVKRLYQAFAAGDAPGIASVVDPAVLWMEAENGPYADRNPYSGLAAVFEGVFGRLGAAFTGFTVTPETWLPSGDRVVVLGRYTGTNSATGEALNAQFAHVFTVANGRITVFQQYTDTEQWMDVVTPD